jgi:hypothetical protein
MNHPLSHMPNFGAPVKTYAHKGKTIVKYKNKGGSTYVVAGCLFHTLKEAKDYIK